MDTLLACLSLSGERLEISPNPVVLDRSGETTITISFLQFQGTPEQPHAFKVELLSNNSAKKLGLVTESGIVHGVAPFTFQATKNGTIRVEAQFRVAVETGVQIHRVTSLVRLICKCLGLSLL